MVVFYLSCVEKDIRKVEYVLKRFQSNCYTQFIVHPFYIYTIPYHTTPYHTIPNHTIPHHNIPYHIIPHTTPHHTYHTPHIPYHIIYHTTHTTHHTPHIPYRTIPHHIIPHHTAPQHGFKHLTSYLVKKKFVFQGVMQHTAVKQGHCILYQTGEPETKISHNYLIKLLRKHVCTMIVAGDEQ